MGRRHCRTGPRSFRGRGRAARPRPAAAGRALGRHFPRRSGSRPIRRPARTAAETIRSPPPPPQPAHECHEGNAPREVLPAARSSAGPCLSHLLAPLLQEAPIRGQRVFGACGPECGRSVTPTVHVWDHAEGQDGTGGDGFPCNPGGLAQRRESILNFGFPVLRGCTLTMNTREKTMKKGSLRYDCPGGNRGRRSRRHRVRRFRRRGVSSTKIPPIRPTSLQLGHSRRHHVRLHRQRSDLRGDHGRPPSAPISTSAKSARRASTPTRPAQPT